MPRTETSGTGNPVLDAYISAVKETFGTRPWEEIESFAQRVWNNVRMPEDPAWDEVKHLIQERWMPDQAEERQDKKSKRP